MIETTIGSFATKKALTQFDTNGSAIVVNNIKFTSRGKSNKTYQTPEIKMPIKTVAISMDDAFVLIHSDGYREAMVGYISLYDRQGERQHTIYVVSHLNMEKQSLEKV